MVLKLNGIGPEPPLLGTFNASQWQARSVEVVARSDGLGEVFQFGCDCVSVARQRERHVDVSVGDTGEADGDMCSVLITLYQRPMLALTLYLMGGLENPTAITFGSSCCLDCLQVCWLDVVYRHDMLPLVGSGWRVDLVTVRHRGSWHNSLWVCHWEGRIVGGGFWL